MAHKMKHTNATFPFKSPLRKQKLSPAAADKKADRDQAYAMGKTWNGKDTSVFNRKAKKAENQSIGQSGDKDIHHVGGKVGNTKKISVAKNRDTFANGDRKRKNK